MTTYTIQAVNTESECTPVLQRGDIIIHATVPVYYMIAEWPIAEPGKCALIRAGESLKLTLKTRCNRVAVRAVNQPGSVSITEKSGGARSSCAT